MPASVSKGRDLSKSHKLLGIILQQYCEESKLTFAELAEVSKGHLAKLEQGLHSPTLHTLEKLAKAFHITTFELIEIVYE